MDAHILRTAALAAALFVSMGATYKTPNFIVTTQSPQMAERLGKAAEEYRRTMALEWLGRELPNWSRPCPMTVKVAANLGAGGETSFLFDNGEVFGWQMNIQGSGERLLDSVLPHEITHMIFASHFRQPLPRWADEGACTTVECDSERLRHKKMLVTFLQSGRGIAFSKMFAMTDYPKDIMPLYAQGHSLASYLIDQKGRREFVAFVGEGLKDRQWPAALDRHYGFSTLAMLQGSWIDWVRHGSPETALSPNRPEGEVLAAARQPRPEPNLIYRAQSADSPAGADRLVPIRRPGRNATSGQIAAQGVAPASPPFSNPSAAEPVAAEPPITSGWRARDRGEVRPAAAWSDASAPAETPQRIETTRPQPVEPSRQVILEWTRPESEPGATIRR
ncbi:MAG: hypothetical protein ACYC35_18335 [Pirellulales bacterium]